MAASGERVRSRWRTGPRGAGGRLGRIDSAAPAQIDDPLALRHRWMLAGLVSLVACIAGTVVSMRAMGPPIVSMLFIFTFAWGAAAGVCIASRTLIPRMHGESPFLQKVCIGLIASTVATVISALDVALGLGRVTGGTLGAIMLPLHLRRHAEWFAYDRADRVQLGPIIGTALRGVHHQPVLAGEREHRDRHPRGNGDARADPGAMGSARRRTPKPARKRARKTMTTKTRKRRVQPPRTASTLPA